MFPIHSVLKKNVGICLWTVYFPSTQQIATSQRHWNFVFFQQHPPYIFLKIVHGWAAEQEKKNVPSCSCLRCPKSTSHSSRFPAHSKYEKNSFYIVVKFEGERHRCTEDMNQEVKRSTLLLFWTMFIYFVHFAPIFLESIGPWVIGERREVKTFKTKKTSDKREIWMREYDKKVVLCESEIRYHQKLGENV